ncbi:MAG: hypothetical protein WC121_06465 [Candidatus Kapaibacterium sp.]
MSELGKYRKCDICCEWHWTGNNCAPAYEVFHDEYMGEESQTVRAHSLSGAAEKYAQKYNEGDGEYTMMDGEEIILRVVKGSDEATFSVSATPSIDYHVNEVEQ